MQPKKKAIIIARITNDMFDRMSKDYRLKQTGIQERISNLTLTDEDYYISSAYILGLVSNAKVLYERADMDEKRELLKLAFQNLLLDEEKVVVTMNKPFDSILKFVESNEWLLG